MDNSEGFLAAASTKRAHRRFPYLNSAAHRQHQRAQPPSPIPAFPLTSCVRATRNADTRKRWRRCLETCSRRWRRRTSRPRGASWCTSTIPPSCPASFDETRSPSEYRALHRACFLLWPLHPARSCSFLTRPVLATPAIACHRASASHRGARRFFMAAICGGYAAAGPSSQNEHVGTSIRTKGVFAVLSRQD